MYAICVRPSPRRWAAIIVPFAAWAVWWLALGRGNTSGLDGGRVGSPNIASTLWHGLRASVDGLVLGNRLLGVLVALAVVVNLGWRLRRGLREGANAVVWTAVLGFWWIALNFSRGELASASTFRYQLVGATLALLTLLPPAPVAWPALVRGRLAGDRLRRRSPSLRSAHSSVGWDTAPRFATPRSNAGRRVRRCKLRSWRISGRRWCPTHSGSTSGSAS